MKIERTVAVAFMLALGYAKAAEWDNAKLADRLRQVPDRIDKDKVPAEQADLYQSLVDLPDQQDLQIAGKGPEVQEGQGKGKEGKKPAAKPAKKGETKPKPAAKEKKEKVPKKETPKDEFGCRVGTVRAKVNAVLSKEWQDEENLIKASGVGEKSALIRLRNASREGLFEVRRLVQYRLAPAKK